MYRGADSSTPRPARASGAAILILALYGFLTERPEFLDIALTYAMLNIIGTFAVLKFLRFGALGDTGEEES